MTGGRASHFRLGLAAALLGWGGWFVWIWPRMFFERSDGLVAGWRSAPPHFQFGLDGIRLKSALHRGAR